MFDTTAKNIGALAAMLAAVTVLQVTAYKADAQDKKNNEPPANSTGIYEKVSKLPACPMVSHSFLGVKGAIIRKTVITTDGGAWYAITFMDWENKYGESVPWVKIEYGPKGKRTAMIGDAHRDGYVDAAVSESEKPAGDEFFDIGGYPAESQFEKFGRQFQHLNEGQKRAARDAWQPEHSRILRDLSRIADEIKKKYPATKSVTGEKLLTVVF